MRVLTGGKRREEEGRGVVRQRGKAAVKGRRRGASESVKRR